MLRSRHDGRRARQGGAIAAEMALIIPVLMALLLGTAELGRIVYTYGTLMKSVRAAARHLSMVDASNSAAWQLAQEEAKNLAVCGEITSCAGKQPLVPHLETSMVLTSKGNTGLTAAPVVTVTISKYIYRRELGYFTWDAMQFNDVRLVMRRLV